MEKFQSDNSWRFDFSPINGEWVDYMTYPGGYKKYTLQQVLRHYGFEELLNVVGLYNAFANNDDYHIRFVERNSQLINVFISPAKGKDRSVRFSFDDEGFPTIMRPL